MGITSLDQCRDFFGNSSEAQALYTYHGPVWGHPEEGAKYITLEGCNTLCGLGPELYHWKDAIVTITTWVLPMLGMLLGAPFESNNFGRNLKAVCRWLGSPIMVISNTLWNIMLTARICLLLDMAVFIDELPALNSRFGRFRDSMYILSIMNQYTMQRYSQEMEGLVRIALFSDIDGPEIPGSLCLKRRDLARNLRAARRRGVVPALISLFWFLFCLAISIEFAFGEMGSNMIAHNLAMGLMLTWLPILILFSIIDRNPSGESDLPDKLSSLLVFASEKLQEVDFIEYLCISSDSSPSDFESLQNFRLQVDEHIFGDFAGQGREHWFLGIAHNIVMGIEANHAAKFGRGWLYDIHCSNAALWKPYGNKPFSWLGARATWQAMIAFIVVCGCCGGAFIISYFTPTVGLGCRSGGYMVYFVLASFLFTLEMGGWNWAERHHHFRRYGSHFLLLVELVNSSWLCWIVLAQVTGAYQTCECMASTWGMGGGYINFGEIHTSAVGTVELYWLVGTSLSCFIFVSSVVFIVVQWCEQSHLSTLDYDNAMRGLVATRRFRMATCWLRSFSDHVGLILGVIMAFISGDRYQQTRVTWSWMPRVKREPSHLSVLSGGDDRSSANSDKGKNVTPVARRTLSSACYSQRDLPPSSVERRWLGRKSPRASQTTGSPKVM